MALERILHNVTVALRCVDGNSRRVLAAPTIYAAGERFVRNRSGDSVLLDRPGLASLVVTVEDPTGFYLPRRATIALPRDPNPANVTAANSLFQPVELALYPTPAAPPASGWAVVRATVVNAANDAPLPGALLRASRTSDNTVIGRGLTEWRGRAAGEAQVAVPGVPAITFGPANGNDDGAVLVSKIDVTIEAIFDPQQLSANAAPPDPDDLEQRRAQLPRASVTTSIGAGTATAVRIAISVP
jgi:hypothetical protein